VLFELGMFIGALGIERCFILAPRSQEGEFRLPTDLAGVTVSFYDDTATDMVDAVTTSCAKIKAALRRAATHATPEVPQDDKRVADQQQLQSLQSALWMLKIDAERKDGELQRLTTAVLNYFHAVAKPATEAEILAWEEGAKTTYPSAPKISRHQAYYVEDDVIIPPLYGAHSISVIVGPGVRVFGLEGFGHSSVYYMDGFRRTGIL
jgi:hypothetical protein